MHSQQHGNQPDLSSIFWSLVGTNNNNISWDFSCHSCRIVFPIRLHDQRPRLSDMLYRNNTSQSYQKRCLELRHDQDNHQETNRVEIECWAWLKIQETFSKDDVFQCVCWSCWIDFDTKMHALRTFKSRICRVWPSDRCWVLPCMIGGGHHSEVVDEVGMATITVSFLQGLFWADDFPPFPFGGIYVSDLLVLELLIFFFCPRPTCDIST